MGYYREGGGVYFDDSELVAVNKMNKVVSSSEKWIEKGNHHLIQTSEYGLLPNPTTPTLPKMPSSKPR